MQLPEDLAELFGEARRFVTKAIEEQGSFKLFAIALQINDELIRVQISEEFKDLGGAIGGALKILVPWANEGKIKASVICSPMPKHLLKGDRQAIMFDLEHKDGWRVYAVVSYYKHDYLGWQFDLPEYTRGKPQLFARDATSRSSSKSNPLTQSAASPPTGSEREFCSKAVAYLKALERPLRPDEIALSQPDSLVVREIADGLAATYVVDVGTHFSFVQQRHLMAAGVTMEELHRQGVHNLAVKAKAKVKLQPYGNIHAVLMGGNFEASLILFDGFWTQSCASMAPNGFVVAIPARDVLAFTDAANADGIQELHDVCARGVGKVDHPITNRLYAYVKGKWHPFRVH